MNRPEINLITVEDPVEYRLGGVNQVQINVRAGLTFASALRSILRSDPDVVMVGEIRDAETAKISIEAALTGHFVLSTLHTNDAPSTITRLGEMGVEPFLTGAAVSAVLAQRLARKLCTHCCEAYQPTEAELRDLRVSPEVLGPLDGTVFYRKKACPRCNHTGYRGRVGVFQFLRMSEEIAALAVQHASRDEIARRRIGERHAVALGRRPREGDLGPHLDRRARARPVLGRKASPSARLRPHEDPEAAAARRPASPDWTSRSAQDAATSQPSAMNASTACVTKRVASTGVGNAYGPACTGRARMASARPRPRRRSGRPRPSRVGGRQSGRPCARA